MSNKKSPLLSTALWFLWWPLRPWTAKYREQNRAQAKEIAGGSRTLVGEGILRNHANRRDLSFEGVCGMITYSITGGERDEVTCRACRRLLRSAGKQP